MSENTDPDHRFTRRRFLAALSAAGVGGFAGCGFGGDGDQTTIPPITTLPPERTPTERPTTTPTQTPTEEPPTTTQPTTTTDGLVEGRTWRMFVPPPKPAETHYNPLRHDAFWFDGQPTMRADLARRSLLDLQFYPEAARNWTYTNGVLTVELHEDLYWASDSDTERNPANVTSDDWVKALSLDGGRATRISRMEQTGTYGFKVFFTDPFPERYALARTPFNPFIWSCNAAFWRSYLERLADATTDEQTDSIRTEARNRPVASPHPGSNMPFRVDSVAADRWVLTLRDDEDPTPRWVDDLTFPAVEIVVNSMITDQTVAFRSGAVPFAGMRPGAGGFREYRLRAFDPAIIDIDVPFETATLTLPRTFSPGTYVMNLNRHPTDNVHFRRAVAYLLDRSVHLTRYMHGDRVITGFSTQADEGRYLSSAFLEMLREAPHQNYGYDAVLTAEATAEMQAGGFERDSAGNWLYQDGDAAGDPISLDIPAHPMMDRLVAASASFMDTLTSFGIEATIRTVSPGSDAYDAYIDGQVPMALGFGGGRLPSEPFTQAFSSPVLVDMRDFPNEWNGPPIGSFATPPAEEPTETTTFDIGLLLGGLPNAGGALLEESVEKLAWVYNQHMARLPIGHQPWIWSVNTDAWSWPLPTEDNPEAWISIPRGKLWQRGFVEGVPDDSG